MSQARSEVTRILQAIEAGDIQRSEELLPVVYQELRALAGQMMAREPRGQTLQATALVHEAYLRLIGPDGEASRWDNRGHFFAAAAQAMRRILVERARRVAGPRRGGGRKRLALDGVDLHIDSDPLEILALDEALDRLAQRDARLAKVVSLRYFAGLSEEETAAALEISTRTVRRDWTFARAWLYKQLSEDRGDEQQKAE